MAVGSAPGAVRGAAERGDGTGARPGGERALRGGRDGRASRRGRALAAPQRLPWGRYRGRGGGSPGGRGPFLSSPMGALGSPLHILSQGCRVPAETPRPPRPGFLWGPASDQVAEAEPLAGMTTCCLSALFAYTGGEAASGLPPRQPQGRARRESTRGDTSM